MLPGDGVLVVVVVELVCEAEDPVALEEEDPFFDGVVLGTTTVTVTLGVVLVATTVPEPGLDFVGDLPVPGWKAAYSTVPPLGAE